ncbi:hypothetical protein PNO31109_03910 [Pandoraea nosoerga]|uniref:Uncharacterized protein n=1 Tax=Pandoraea nosoerga TaxID=2508296 RepID=A0A5E4XIW9_9BURK|nr:hypothetical protein PNO31109_03910 [Pandoraea nosoerga]
MRVSGKFGKPVCVTGRVLCHSTRFLERIHTLRLPPIYTLRCSAVRMREQGTGLLKRLRVARSFGTNVVLAERDRDLRFRHNAGHEVGPERFPPARASMFLDVALTLDVFHLMESDVEQEVYGVPKSCPCSMWHGSTSRPRMAGQAGASATIRWRPAIHPRLGATPPVSIPFPPGTRPARRAADGFPTTVPAPLERCSSPYRAQVLASQGTAFGRGGMASAHGCKILYAHTVL